MLLASLLGLRSGDIKGLRFEQIDWANRRLSLAQRKTGRRLDLPLPDECAFAIIDYWKNERPEVGDPHVFLRHRAPLETAAAKTLGPSRYDHADRQDLLDWLRQVI